MCFLSAGKEEECESDLNISAVSDDTPVGPVKVRTDFCCCTECGNSLEVNALMQRNTDGRTDVRAALSQIN